MNPKQTISEITNNAASELNECRYSDLTPRQRERKLLRIANLSYNNELFSPGDKDDEQDKKELSDIIMRAKEFLREDAR